MNDYVPVDYQNPHASKGLKLALKLVSNTPDEEIEHNIRTNSRQYTNWLKSVDAHTTPAVMIGGGDSINDHIEDIKELQKAGATVFALNAASKWARTHGIEPDHQVIIDAKAETADLVDPETPSHLFASRCNPATLEQAKSLTLVHLEDGNIERLFPQERLSKGGYVLVGGDTTVGTCALCVAYSQGFRDIHVFGYDSSHREGKSHAYQQRMNNNMPTMEIEHGGRKYIASIAMSKQPMSFLIYSQALKDAGCEFHVYGEGLLQAIYNTRPEDLTEREKYQLMWQLDDYRNVSPGEQVVDLFIDKFNPDGRVIDFGCGTGRAGLKMRNRGIDVLLIDFAVNSRDSEAMGLPFRRYDLTGEIPEIAPYGFCTDVMEHIPTKDVEKVITNIMGAASRVFFQISTVDDVMGAALGEPLHLTVKPHSWWKTLFERMGYTVEWENEQNTASLFYISTPTH